MLVRSSGIDVLLWPYFFRDQIETHVLHELNISLQAACGVILPHKSELGYC
jgi:hypothetical protein